MSFIIKDTKNNIARLTIDRPEAMNAMNEVVLNELESAIRSCIDDKSVGVMIISGSGDKAFVAGADIKKMQKIGPDEALVFAKAGQGLTLTIENSPKPIIAAINGYALGGGCEISLACHIRVCSDNAMFGQPEVLLGILPGWGGTQRLPKIVGLGLANEIITTGRMVKSFEAKEIGLVNHVVSQDQLITKCEEIANQILKNGPDAIAESLSCIRHGDGKSTQDGLEEEAHRFSQLFGKKESNEGLSAFVEKRDPRFRE